MNEQQRSISELKLERYLLGELPQRDMEVVRQELARDPGLRARLAALEQSDREVLAQYPPAWMGRRMALRLGGGPTAEKRTRSPLARYWPVPAAAMAVLVAAATVLLAPRDGENLKGIEPRLMLFRKSAAGNEKLQEGSAAAQGDLVQIVYHAAGMKYGAILSLDGRGALTVHLPAAGDRAVALRPSGPDTLAYAYLLDDAPRFERFYLITADTSFSLAEIRAGLVRMRNAAEAGKLELGKGYKQYVFTLGKERSHEE